MTTPAEPSSETLWTWALAAYARPGVADACLALQDEHGLSVGLLLWAAWPRSDGDGGDGCEAAAAVALAWERAALRPLRAARRGLKQDLPGDAAARLDLRAHVQDLELVAERLLLETLEQLPRGAGDGPTLARLRRAASAWSAPAAAVAALDRLADLLEGGTG